MYYLTSMRNKKGVLVLCNGKQQVASFPALLNRFKCPEVRDAVALVRGTDPHKAMKANNGAAMLAQLAYAKEKKNVPQNLP